MKEDSKSLFFQYDGNHGEMHRDAVFNTYKALGVSDFQEKEWAKELQRLLFIKVRESHHVGPEFHRLVDLIEHFHLNDGLISLTSTVKEWISASDTFTLILAAERILDALEYLQGNLEYADRMTIVQVLENIAAELKSSSDYSVDEFYKTGFMLPGSFDKKVLANRVEKINERVRGIS